MLVSLRISRYLSCMWSLSISDCISDCHSVTVSLLSFPVTTWGYQTPLRLRFRRLLPFFISKIIQKLQILNIKVILRSENSEISSFVELKKTGVWRFSSLSRRRPACVCRSVRIWALSLVQLCTFEEVAAQAEALVEDHWRNKAVLNE